ncbi:hypothetical protein B0H13DRAFT_2301145 [Mycena leptocephala]|nr:hypothetical protein B0H13DRAFT_2301145 [Mycena leptocephala]
MPSLVKYDDRPPGKMLPARGTLFASRPEAVASQYLQWLALNFSLFLLPFLTGFLAILTAGRRLGLYGHQAPHHLAFTLAYFAICSGSVNVCIVSSSLVPSTII